MRQKWANWWLISVFRSPYLDLDTWYWSLKTCRVVGKDLGHAFALIVVKESLCCVCPPPVFSSQVHSWPGHPPSPCRSHSWSSVTPFAAKVAGGHPLVLPSPSTPIWRKHTPCTWLMNVLNTRFTIDSKCSQAIKIRHPKISNSDQ